MTIPSITTNTLVDQALLSTIVAAINSNTSKLSNSAVRVYDRGSGGNGGKQVSSYLGNYTFATTQLEFSHTLSKETKSISKSFQFGQTFLNAPLVFATVEADVSGGTNSSVYITNHSVTIVNPTTTGATAYLTIAPHQNTGVVEYKISIFAIGLISTNSTL
jgi:hypothetical protein